MPAVEDAPVHRVEHLERRHDGPGGSTSICRRPPLIALTRSGPELEVLEDQRRGRKRGLEAQLGLGLRRCRMESPQRQKQGGDAGR